MKLPNLSYEKGLWKRGFDFVAGADEVGRGCFAGPVVAAAVAFAPEVQSSKFKVENYNSKVKIVIPLGKNITGREKSVFIGDSKKLTPKQREISDKWIRKNALTYGIGEVTAATINRIGMGKATQMAFRRAIASANWRAKSRIEYLLIDAFYIPYIRGIPIRNKTARKNHKLRDGRARQRAIVNGDEKVMSIAAASIIAKVYRDSLMQEIGQRAKYKKYDWVRNKGYAAKKHQEAILKYGITGYHRKQFVNTFLEKKGKRVQ